ncbi:MAG TPA: hypothetical protein VFB80_15700 [Pirellulaceae bacterium]|nr:hypothetical protein [Pirellulaceae bacterium]
MRVSFTRSLFLGTVCVSLMACAGGCRSGGTGWTTPSWMNWSNWTGGGSTTAPSTSLSQNTRPGMGVAKPSTQVSPQATASVAAGTGGTGAAGGYPGGYTGATNPRYTTTTSPPPSYGAGTSGYGAAPASAYQQASTSGQVQPTVGYQTGPYSMTSAAAPQNPYAQSGYGQNNAAAGSTGGSTWSAPAAAQPAAAPANNYGASAYTADQRGMYGAQEASPYASDPSRQGYSTGQPAYGQQPAAAPSAATGPWQNYTQPAGGYQSSAQPAGAAGTAAYDPSAAAAYAAAAAAAASQPAATTAAASGYPAVPAALATDASSFKPGSTGGYGVQNAAYQQQPATAQTYGNTYQR